MSIQYTSYGVLGIHRIGHFVPATEPAKQGRRTPSVFISGLPEGICKRDIVRAFSRFGIVEELHLDRRRNCAIVDLHDEHTASVTVSTQPFVVKLSQRTNSTARLKLGYSNVCARDLTARDARAAAEAARTCRLRSATAWPKRATPPSSKPGTKKRPQSARPAARRPEVQLPQRPHSARPASPAASARAASTDSSMASACWLAPDKNAAGINKWLSIPRRALLKDTQIDHTLASSRRASEGEPLEGVITDWHSQNTCQNSDLTVGDFQGPRSTITSSSRQDMTHFANDNYEILL